MREPAETKRAALFEGRLKSGDFVGTELDIAKKFGVSRIASRDVPPHDPAPMPVRRKETQESARTARVCGKQLLAQRCRLAAQGTFGRVSHCAPSGMAKRIAVNAARAIGIVNGSS